MNFYGFEKMMNECGKTNKENDLDLSQECGNWVP